MISELKIRKLNESGIEAFRSYLHELRTVATTPPPYELLTDSKASASVAGDGMILNRQFATRLEAARYFDEALSENGKTDIDTNIGLWSWLSLFYFDQVSPVDKQGRRKPGRDYRHILEPGYPNGHRHLLGGAYLVYTTYGWADEISPLLLCTPTYVESQFNHEFASRQNFITNRGIMEAAYKLYYNPITRKAKHGTQVKKGAPGTLYRYIHVIQQLDLNYDLYSMRGTEIISLLPPEFDKWKG